MSAVLSDCGTYRYALWRQIQQPFDEAGHRMTETCLFVMLNPSTADATEDDPTIRRCVGFAREWGFGRVAIGNLYALRSTDPAALASHPDPVGPDNSDWICNLVNGSALTIAAWGASPHAAPEQTDWVSSLLGCTNGPLMCLGRTKHGHPRHPLYVRADTEPVPFQEAPDAK